MVTPVTPNLPPPLSPEQFRAAAWLHTHLVRDPELYRLFYEASQTSWKPVVEFIGWAQSRNLLGSLPAGKEVQR